MVVQTEIVEALRTRVHALYAQIHEEYTPIWPAYVTEITGAETVNKMDWFGAMPIMREVKGPIDIGKVHHHDYTITVGRQGVGILVELKMLYHNRLDQVGLMLRDFFARTVTYEDRVCAQTLSAGFSTTCFDGQYFYDSDHSWGDSGTVSNVGTAAFSADDPTAYNVAWSAINTCPDEQGIPMGFVPTHLVVHPDLRDKTLRLLKAQTVKEGGTNVYAGDVQVIVTAHLSTATEWHLLACGRPVKPIVKMVEIPFSTATIDDSELIAKNGYAEYYVTGAMQPGYAHPGLAYGSTGVA